MKKNTPQIAVIGGREESEETLNNAKEIGALIAANGWNLVCGGLGGVMEAACRGAFEANGLTIGILPGKYRRTANRWVKVPIATGIDVARNSIIANTADAAIAVGGKYGTLSEIAYFLQMNKPVITLACQWDIEGTISATSPEDAIVKIEQVIKFPPKK